MEISLESVQELAPDQSSLNAAKKLLSPAKWPVRGQAPSVNTIWGQCQGSGANPYFTMADVVDHGYKCTCPSRKFPCKHVLALMWQFAEGAADFHKDEPPEWVNDWLGRRRKSGKPIPDPEKPAVKKSIALAEGETHAELSPDVVAKREAANAKRAAQVKANAEASISDGLNDFQQWVSDQLRTGLSTFLKEMNERCRQIAARLVDAKATNLASRLDELPAKIFSLNAELQPSAVLKEFGQLVLLCESWYANPDDPDTRRAIATGENREYLLKHPSAIRRSGVWETLGEKIETRRDGLVSHASWLLNITEVQPCFALLLDYYPASVGRREAGFSTGRQIEGELVFYPSRLPLRALVAEHEVLSPQHQRPWNCQGSDLWGSYADHLNALPWTEHCPCLLKQGRILLDPKHHYWWQNADTQEAIPLINSHLNPLLLGTDLDSAFVVWNGEHAELFSTQTSTWGALAC